MVTKKDAMLKIFPRADQFPFQISFLSLVTIY